MGPGEGRTLVGHVTEIRRYPVKSMQGERLERAALGPNGIDGDRRFAVIDAETGRVASAKNPRKWAGLLDLRAELRDGVLVVTAPDGSELRSDRDDLDAALSRLFGRPVILRNVPPATAAIEIQWPDVAGLPNAGSESVEGLPPGGFFDLAPLHLLTTASLRHFRELAPASDFDPRRFRPNLVVEPLPSLVGFVEAEWVGRTVVVGEMPLSVTAPCSRCVMTTLAQPGLPADQLVLRAAVAHNAAVVGVYASVGRTGALAFGDPVWVVGSGAASGTPTSV
jgi:uncharacterized protein